MIYGYPLRTWDHLVDLRNRCRESLRTPTWSTFELQDEWAKKINRPEGNMWYWDFWTEKLDPYEDAVELSGQKTENVGFGGLVNIDRVNRSAEIAIGVYEKHRRQGYGRQIVDWLINEAFDAQNMHKVWAEVYDCNPNKDAWEHMLQDYPRVTKCCRQHQKFWAGVYWGSTIYEILA